MLEEDLDNLLRADRGKTAPIITMRYILFAGQDHCAGGANDIKGWGNSVDNLKSSAVLKGPNIDWWNIYDTQERVIIESYNTHYHADR